MLTITRERAVSCTDAQLQSFLKGLFNVLADEEIEDHVERSCHASIQTIKAEQARPGRCP